MANPLIYIVDDILLNLFLNFQRFFLVSRANYDGQNGQDGEGSGDSS